MFVDYNTETLHMFDRYNGEWLDFSNFKPLSEYTESQRRKLYKGIQPHFNAQILEMINNGTIKEP